MGVGDGVCDLWRVCLRTCFFVFEAAGVGVGLTEAGAGERNGAGAGDRTGTGVRFGTVEERTTLGAGERRGAGVGVRTGTVAGARVTTGAGERRGAGVGVVTAVRTTVGRTGAGTFDRTMVGVGDGDR